MIIKLSFKGEIHRLSKQPESFADLFKYVKEVFGNKIPENIALQYEDSEGDNVMLTNEEDYKAMLDSESERNSMKIFVLPGEGDNNNAGGASDNDKASQDELERLRLEQEEKDRLEAEQLAAEKEQALREALLAEEEEKRKAEELEAALEAERLARAKAEADESERQEAERKAIEAKNLELAEQARIAEEVRLATEAAIAEEARLAEAKKVEEELARLAKEREDEEQREIERIEKERIDRELFLENQRKQAEADRLAALKEAEEKERQRQESERIAREEQERIEAEERAAEEARAKNGGGADLETTKAAVRSVMLKELLPQMKEILKAGGAGGAGAEPQVVEKEKIVYVDRDVQVEKVVYKTHPDLQAILGDLIKSYNQLPEYHRESIDQGLNNTVQKLIKVSQQLDQQPVVGGSKPEEQKRDDVKVDDNSNASNTTGASSVSKDFDAQFIKEVSSIPSRVSTKDMVIYKTVAVRNSGSKAWPKNTTIRTVDKHTQADVSKLTSVQPGKEFSSVLILRNPGQPGTHKSLWRLCYTDDTGATHYIGEAFQLTLVVDGPGGPVNVNPVVNPNDGGAKYSTDVVDKAKQLKNILTDASLDNLLVFVNKNKSASIEQLINDFLAN